MRMAGAGGMGLALTALTVLCACNAPETPDTVAKSLLPALGLSRLQFAKADAEVEAVNVGDVRGVALGRMSWTAATARIVRPHRDATGLEAEAVILARPALAPPDEPERPRALANAVTFDHPRTDAPIAAWRSAEAEDVSFLDGDAGTRLSLSKAEITLNTVGSAGEIAVAFSAVGITPRQSWLAGLGASPCVLAAFASAGPLSLTGTLRYLPSEKRLSLNDVSLSGRTGTILLSARLDNVATDRTGLAGLVSALGNWDDLPSEIRLESARLDFRDGGASAACLSAVPELGRSNPRALPEAVRGLPFLSDEGDRNALATEILAFLARPGSFSLTADPVDDLSLRSLGPALTSTARRRYMTLVLSVNGRIPLTSGTPVATTVAAPGQGNVP